MPHDVVHAARTILDFVRVTVEGCSGSTVHIIMISCDKLMTVLKVST